MNQPPRLYSSFLLLPNTK